MTSKKNIAYKIPKAYDLKILERRKVLELISDIHDQISDVEIPSPADHIPEQNPATSFLLPLQVETRTPLLLYVTAELTHQSLLTD